MAATSAASITVNPLIQRNYNNNVNKASLLQVRTQPSRQQSASLSSSAPHQRLEHAQSSTTTTTSRRNRQNVCCSFLRYAQQHAAAAALIFTVLTIVFNFTGIAFHRMDQDQLQAELRAHQADMKKTLSQASLMLPRDDDPYQTSYSVAAVIVAKFMFTFLLLLAGIVLLIGVSLKRTGFVLIWQMAFILFVAGEAVELYILIREAEARPVTTTIFKLYVSALSFFIILGSLCTVFVICFLVHIHRSDSEELLATVPATGPINSNNPTVTNAKKSALHSTTTSQRIGVSGDNDPTTTIQSNHITHNVITASSSPRPSSRHQHQRNDTTESSTTTQLLLHTAPTVQQQQRLAGAHTHQRDGDVDDEEENVRVNTPTTTQRNDRPPTNAPVTANNNNNNRQHSTTPSKHHHHHDDECRASSSSHSRTNGPVDNNNNSYGFNASNLPPPPPPLTLLAATTTTGGASSLLRSRSRSSLKQQQNEINNNFELNDNPHHQHNRHTQNTSLIYVNNQNDADNDAEILLSPTGRAEYSQHYHHRPPPPSILRREASFGATNQNQSKTDSLRSRRSLNQQQQATMLPLPPPPLPPPVAILVSDQPHHYQPVVHNTGGSYTNYYHQNQPSSSHQSSQWQYVGDEHMRFGSGGTVIVEDTSRYQNHTPNRSRQRQQYPQQQQQPSYPATKPRRSYVTHYFEGPHPAVECGPVSLAQFNSSYALQDENVPLSSNDSRREIIVRAVPVQIPSQQHEYYSPPPPSRSQQRPHSFTSNPAATTSFASSSTDQQHPHHQPSARRSKRRKAQPVGICEGYSPAAPSTFVATPSTTTPPAAQGRHIHQQHIVSPPPGDSAVLITRDKSSSSHDVRKADEAKVGEGGLRFGQQQPLPHLQYVGTKHHQLQQQSVQASSTASQIHSQSQQVQPPATSSRRWLKESEDSGAEVINGGSTNS